jgi:hypothetical protein
LSLDDLFAAATVGPDERPRAVRDAGGEVERLERSLKPPRSLQETDFLKYQGQLNMARRIAEEQVLADMVFLPPEPGLESEAGEPELDETGAFIDRGWKSPALTEVSDEEWAEHQAAGTWRPLRTNGGPAAS